VNLILSAVKNKKYILMKSPVHLAEINDIKDDFERKELLSLLENYGETVTVVTNQVRSRTEELLNQNFGIADSAHVAFAESYNSVFITCDDKLISKCARSVIGVRFFNPVTFCDMENLK
jgi:predicted nucleic acid-binding protein